jgi:RHS repeat-associated protein
MALRMRHNYTYAAFGTTEGQRNTQNSYRFTGEQFDESLGEYYLRDRYYNAALGRFTRRDLYEGRISNALTQHKYLYTQNNPANLTDPTGLFTIGELVVVDVLLSIFATHAFVNYTGLLFAGSEEPTDQAIVYIGYSSDPGNFFVGHTAIEINGGIYDYPGQSRNEPVGRWLSDEMEDYSYYSYHRYAINYNTRQLAQLKQNLETSLSESGRYASPLNYTVFGAFQEDELLYAQSCTTFVLDNLPQQPNNDWRFDLIARRNISPFGLDADLSLLYAMSGGKTVKRLPDIV